MTAKTKAPAAGEIGHATLTFTQITADDALQPRAALNPDIVEEYAEAVKAGAELPPLTVFFDGTTYYLADGFHRRAAYKEAGENEISVEIHFGTRRDALLYSLGANEDHGLRRNKGDRKRAVLTMLRDEEWREWSVVDIAAACKVSRQYVHQLKQELACTVNSLHVNNGKTTSLPANAQNGHGAEYFEDAEAEEEDTGFTDEEISEAYTVPAVPRPKPQRSDPAPVTPAAIDEDDLTDEEYLLRCPTYRRLMQFPHKGREFRVNALAYRAMSESAPGKPTIIGQIKHCIGRSFDAAPTGPLYTLMARLSFAPMPQEWPLCVKCQGKLVVFANTGDHTGSGPEIVCKGCTGGYTL